VPNKTKTQKRKKVPFFRRFPPKKGILGNIFPTFGYKYGQGWKTIGV